MFCSFFILEVYSHFNSGSCAQISYAEDKELITIIACGPLAAGLFLITNLRCLVLHCVSVWRWTSCKCRALVLIVSQRTESSIVVVTSQNLLRLAVRASSALLYISQYRNTATRLQKSAQAPSHTKKTTVICQREFQTKDIHISRCTLTQQIFNFEFRANRMHAFWSSFRTFHFLLQMWGKNMTHTLLRGKIFTTFQIAVGFFRVEMLGIFSLKIPFDKNQTINLLNVLFGGGTVLLQRKMHEV